jgi:hypothetical protein
LDGAGCIFDISMLLWYWATSKIGVDGMGGDLLLDYWGFTLSISMYESQPQVPGIVPCIRSKSLYLSGVIITADQLSMSLRVTRIISYRPRLGGWW